MAKLFWGAFLLTVLNCGSGASSSPAPAPSPSCSEPDSTLPRFVTANYIDLSSVGRISRFRSAVGHDYSDGIESCRNMKHYFEPRAADWSAVTIVAPVDGTVVGMDSEWAGVRISIQSSAYPEFVLQVFHVQPVGGLTPGLALQAGQTLGTHVGPQTYSDISVRRNGTALVSYFDLVTEAVFAEYRARGVPCRSSLIISREERDGDPLSCSGGSFTNSGTIESWVTLN